MDLSLVFENWEFFALGVFNTVTLSGLALLLGGALCIPLAIARATRHPIFNGPVWCFTYFFRGTPLLGQLFLIYYGLGQFETVRESFLWPVLKEAYWCAVIAFTLNTAAYTTEILRGTIEATPLGEVEAAKAAGMSKLTLYRRIILPSAIRRALPAYSNEVVLTIQGSVVASTATIIDILGAGRYVNGKYYVAYEGFISAAVLYMILVFIVSRAFKLWEKHWLVHLRPRESS